MKILVLNAGSSSIKFQLIETTRELIDENADRRLVKGSVVRIGMSGAEITYEGEEDHHEVGEILTHRDALDRAISLIREHSSHTIDAVGHRVVHGGEHFSSSVEVTSEVETQIQKCTRYAPLHNPHNLEGIRAAREVLPGLPQVAAFDTGVHQTLPPKAYLYAIPRQYYHRDGIRKYGFHGLSHRYLRFRVNRLLEKPAEEQDFITCHLGNGASVTAFEGSSVVDTSMGFTPLEGLVMGTRCGDLDPAVVLYLMLSEGMTPHEMDMLLNKQSGLLGLSGVSNDMEKLIEKSDQGHREAHEAIEVFCHRLKKYIGSYVGVLNGADALVFSGGIGEHSPLIREKSAGDLEALGLELDEAENERAIGEERRISPGDDPPHVYVIPTDEEMVIARDTVRCLT